MMSKFNTADRVLWRPAPSVQKPSVQKQAVVVGETLHSATIRGELREDLVRVEFAHEFCRALGPADELELLVRAGTDTNEPEEGQT